MKKKIKFTRPRTIKGILLAALLLSIIAAAVFLLLRYRDAEKTRMAQKKAIIKYVFMNCA